MFVKLKHYFMEYYGLYVYPVVSCVELFFIGVGGELMQPHILRFPTLFVINIKDNNFIWKERLFL